MRAGQSLINILGHRHLLVLTCSSHRPTHVVPLATYVSSCPAEQPSRHVSPIAPPAAQPDCTTTPFIWIEVEIEGVWQATGKHSSR